MNRSTFFMFLLFLCPVISWAQHPSLSRFQAKTVPGGIYLEWTMIAGRTCVGTIIDRRSSNGSFIQVGTIDGICGSVTEPEDFEFMDTNPLDGEQNDYRLTLGNSGVSEPISILYFNFKGFAAIVLQDPSAQTISVVPRSTFSETTEVEILNSAGLKVDAFLLFSEGPTVHSIESLNSGVYFVRITRGRQVIFTDRFVKFE